MFVIREVRESDLEGLYELAELLKLSSKVYFYSLPHSYSLLKEKIELSVKSFAGGLDNPLEGEYIFVLENQSENKVIGSSMIVAQHGTEESPHQYFTVKKQEKHSDTLHMGFIHEVLEYGYDTDGPTEIGGLVLDPLYRKHNERLGLQLSYIRFVYMAMRKAAFRDTVLAELQPPLTAGGKSPLWEAVGRRFTNLAYHEADELSRKNKEFIISLFPEGNIYTCLLNTRAREAIGMINPDTLPVKHMLEKIGFHYLHMIDPFDGGPHFGAKTSEISIVKGTTEYPVTEQSDLSTSQNSLVATQSKSGFIAIYTQTQIRDNTAFISPQALDILSHPPTIFVYPVT